MDYQPLYQALSAAGAEQWVENLPQQIKRALSSKAHGTLRQWRSLVEQMPRLSPSSRELVDDVRIGRADDISDEQRLQLEAQLKALCPWRKGPYQVYGIEIDTEWRSDWKWERLRNHIAPLQGRMVLDVGCGNGYHCWRMLGAGASMVVGIDPALLNVIQFHAIRKLYGDAPIFVLPFGIEAVPNGSNVFDTVFSMGVLYHRRSPIDHLLDLKACLRPGGELVLETLIIEGKQGEVLVPQERYARMRNVWFLPSSDTLIGWMQRCGFADIRLVDVCKTSLAEQRSTEWMPFHSLKNFLDPDNPALTCEGYPAPIRAIFTARLA
ncbi:tRNA 5-methoxyuridine(34)/uridine 5-oxyacetic acid(34) synthase CmoB [Methylomarinum sp. Ch1-1]|uniref:tRNA U34 carboxymethyltransferase n=1 Tax=Methylomarinum roseum TaxID=3067653 RepID=A0AAU7NY49_9GAMM|nr:tRNA 5-methoxyuridine(34)/uridine 5-oxyacetic acid(34) synthase CmoB [Methylomarinum sp. Ch1-1]MDP4521976.1 tRNA 5-methoxyuridine(34)/uridine 5-oxyacetic acid(34) synthase CmoB [Methylomarinum sp. Ch1-1]